MPLVRRTVSSPRSPAASRRSLPDWYDGSRVQGHTRLSIGRWLDEPEWTNAAAGFRGLGARAFARHVKSRREEPWWPTALPLGPDGRPLSDRDRTINGKFVPRGRNVVQEIVDEARAEGVRLVAYHWHMTEENFESLKPEWICRRPNGNPID